MKNIKTMTKSINIYREGHHPIFGDGVIEVSLEDEAGGFFLMIKSNEMSEELRIDYDELKQVLIVADSLMSQDAVTSLEEEKDES